MDRAEEKGILKSINIRVMALEKIYSRIKMAHTNIERIFVQSDVCSRMKLFFNCRYYFFELRVLIYRSIALE